MGGHRPSLAPWHAVAALTALGALLRFPTLDVQSFWLDEATTVRLVGFDLGGLLSAVAREEVTPPLYYLVAWAWAVPFGAGEVGLRSLSALLGTALVPVAYLVARELASRRTALLTGGLVAASPLLVWYSQEARSYALLALLGALSLLFFLRASRTGRGADLAGWALVSALALATHYFALFLVAGEAVWLLAAFRRRSMPTATAAVGAVGLAGLALLPVALAQQAGPGVDWIGQHPLLGRALLVPKKFLVGETGFLIPGARALVALLVVAALVMLVRTDPDERRPAWWGPR
ncbi:MAG: glycosyltransferase family 39 protein [Thermoleophilaceae bacterium]